MKYNYYLNNNGFVVAKLNRATNYTTLLEECPSEEEYYYDSGISDWVISDTYQSARIKADNDIIYAELDLLQAKALKNEFRYKNDAKYEEYKLKYEAELLELENKLK